MERLGMSGNDQGMDDPYHRIPELYDLEHADFAEDLDLYLQLAEVIGDPILELGCGTGRVLLPLARAGHRVTGIDRSAAMLERAQDALAAHDGADRITLFEATMAEADRAPGGPFGLAIFSLNGFMHLAEPGEQRAALQAARRALDPRGMLVIDVMNPSHDILAAFDGRVQHEAAWIRADGSSVDRFSARTHHSVEQRIETDLWYDLVNAAGQLNRVRTSFPMRYVVLSELELLLEITGFVEWKLYGTYDLDPYDSSSERLIVTAEVTPS
jgi:SAM-dependent methyltransferase